MKIPFTRFISQFRVLSTLLGILAIALGGGWAVQVADGDETAATAEETANPTTLPATVDEARSRARWLHEAIHGALQVMHRDFFEEDLADNILPSQSLDDVFEEMARTFSVEIRWLGVNANRGKDHLPKDRFEERASAALAEGKNEYEAVENGKFRFVGLVRLSNECLKCHVRDRSSLENRKAGLAIAFPMKIADPK